MNLHIRKFLTFAPALVLLAATTAFADGVVTLSPGPVGPGQVFTLAVNITGPTVKDVPSGVSDVYAFELDLSFPSSLVQARQVADGTFLPGGGTTYFSRGTIDCTLALTSTVPPAAGKWISSPGMRPSTVSVSSGPFVTNVRPRRIASRYWGHSSLSPT